jgi:hypothetical protein
MVTCYPGNGSKYIKHSDNPHKNGRKLTVIYYLNHNWKKGDGGELRVYDKDNETVARDIEPIADRLVVFYSDKRVPHEVLPNHKERFAITHWFYDHSERGAAEVDTKAAGMSVDMAIEQERINAEIAGFEKAQASTAQVFNAQVAGGVQDQLAAAATSSSTPTLTPSLSDIDEALMQQAAAEAGIPIDALTPMMMEAAAAALLQHAAPPPDREPDSDDESDPEDALKCDARAGGRIDATRRCWSHTACWLEASAKNMPRT